MILTSLLMGRFQAVQFISGAAELTNLANDLKDHVLVELAASNTRDPRAPRKPHL